MAFSYTILDQGDVRVIELEGTLLDKAQALPMLEQIAELIDDNMVKWVLSMERFQYINSTGLNILINILTKARKAGGEAIITAVPDKINDLLLITKLNMVFTVTKTMQEALDHLK